MKWEKASSEMMKVFDSLLPEDTRVEKRKMFGYSCAFTNGNMFCGMHGNMIVVRLPEARRAELMKKGWTQFVPMPGRVMKEYLVIPAGKEAAARGVIKESLEYAFSLKKGKK